MIYETHSQLCFTTLHATREAAEEWIATEGQKYHPYTRHFWAIRKRSV